ncbi:bifunctional 5,10-methylenetetrahydrofolate dehydrogenase/5,10-methenyltetrahydrofolate cyclohydrolase [Patescibacteria group bacterium]|nr:MAG: bifunctional 5,10-methylenetetrahydrofolate dehydrogenase/5,10-methenyltetrahydrofolate cyclohydrolase [Patescibacteria group bacterium]
MGQLIDGKLIAKHIEAETARRVALLKEKGAKPKLAVFLVGEDKPSQKYVKKKGEAAQRVGLDFVLHELAGDIGMAELVEKIEDAQHNEELSGIIIQLPLPEHLYTSEVLNAIHPEIDVDCLTDVNLGKLVMKTNHIVPPTPGAVITIIKDLGVDLVGKNVVIIGAGALVGKPLSIMMMNERASVTTCNSATRDTKEKCLSADIIVTGVGKKDLLRGGMVKEGAIVIDTGVAFVDGKMYGDVNVDEVMERAAHVTPTPGGVGPLTVVRLLWNTVLCAERNLELGLKPHSRERIKYEGHRPAKYKL